MLVFDFLIYLAVFIGGVLFTFFSKTVLPFEYEKWRENKIEEETEKEEWKENMRQASEKMVNIRDNEVEGAKERNGTIDRKRLQSKMVVIADQLQELKSSKFKLNEDVENQIDELINACRAVDDFLLGSGSKNYENFKEEVVLAAKEAEKLRDIV